MRAYLIGKDRAQALRTKSTLAKTLVARIARKLHWTPETLESDTTYVGAHPHANGTFLMTIIILPRWRALMILRGLQNYYEGCLSSPNIILTHYFQICHFH